MLSWCPRHVKASVTVSMRVAETVITSCFVFCIDILHTTMYSLEGSLQRPPFCNNTVHANLYFQIFFSSLALTAPERLLFLGDNSFYTSTVKIRIHKASI